MGSDKVNLEDYLNQHRTALDDLEEVPAQKMWTSIYKQVAQETVPPGNSGWHLSIGRNWRWSIAAAITLLLGIYLLRPAHPVIGHENRLADFYPELAQEEERYEQLIARKEEEIGFHQLNPESFKSIFEELSLLEHIHTEYRRDLPEFYDNEQLVGTLIRFYEQKIRILERLTFELEKQKEHEKRNSERHI